MNVAGVDGDTNGIDPCRDILGCCSEGMRKFSASWINSALFAQRDTQQVMRACKPRLQLDNTLIIRMRRSSIACAMRIDGVHPQGIHRRRIGNRVIAVCYRALQAFESCHQFVQVLGDVVYQWRMITRAERRDRQADARRSRRQNDPNRRRQSRKVDRNVSVERSEQMGAHIVGAYHRHVKTIARQCAYSCLSLRRDIIETREYDDAQTFTAGSSRPNHRRTASIHACAEGGVVLRESDAYAR